MYKPAFLYHYHLTSNTSLKIPLYIFNFFFPSLLGINPIHYIS